MSNVLQTKRYKIARGCLRMIKFWLIVLQFAMTVVVVLQVVIGSAMSFSDRTGRHLQFFLY